MWKVGETHHSLFQRAEVDGYLSLSRDHSDYKCDDPLLKDWIVETGGASLDDVRSFLLEHHH